MIKHRRLHTGEDAHVVYEEAVKMNLYECSYYHEDWICYVFAETRGKTGED